MTSDQEIARPAHYQKNIFQVTIDPFPWICAYSFAAGNFLKYIMRAEYKGQLHEDLIKAEEYASRMHILEEPLEQKIEFPFIYQHFEILHHFMNDKGVIDRTQAAIFVGRLRRAELKEAGKL